MDPAKGYKKIKREEFIKEWTNIILIFKPYKKIPLYKLTNKLKELFLNTILKEKKIILKIIITNIIITILSITISYYIKTITNYIS